MTEHWSDEMALDPKIVSDGLLEELDRFATLVNSIDEDDWQRPTRCTGWSVADVAGHLIGTMTDIVEGRLEGLGTPEVTQREVEERRGRSPKELADECFEARTLAANLLASFDEAAWSQPAPGGYDGTLTEAVEALWYDAYLHADDIRAALGRPTEIGPGLAASTSHVLDQAGKLGWSGEAPADDEAAHEFVLVATGRASGGAGSPPNIYAA
jgi:uncharacterized protein (TIGR03083 family)